MSLITKIEFINKSDNISLLKKYDIEMHDHLTDNADWDSECWDFEPGYLLKFSKALNEIFNISTNGITFQAMWVGEIPKEIIELSIPELLNIIETNKIKTRAKYSVIKSA